MKEKSMTKEYLNRLSLTLIPFTARQVIRLLAATMRIEYVNYDGVWSMWREGRNVIVAFWHGRLMMMPIVYRGKGMNILVSNHRDGELVARTVKGLGIDSVRGSSTRGVVWRGKGAPEGGKVGKGPRHHTGWAKGAEVHCPGRDSTDSAGNRSP